MHEYIAVCNSGASHRAQTPAPALAETLGQQSLSQLIGDIERKEIPVMRRYKMGYVRAWVRLVPKK